MFTKPPQRTKIDDIIDELLDAMAHETPSSKEYASMMGHLTTLYKLKENHSRKPVSPDTVLIVAGNLLGIVLILGYERVNVISSKALGFVMRLR